MTTNRIVKVVSATVLIALLLAMTVSAAGPKWTGAFFLKGKVGLKWQATEGAQQYAVYRKSSDSEFEQITVTEKTQYFDTEVSSGSVYTYKVAAVGADGSEDFSSEKNVTIPGGSSGPFEPPVWSGLRIDRNKIMLRWDQVEGAIAYNIFRSQTSGSGFEVVGNATSVRYADKDGLVMGETYYYVVTALNEEFDETEYSEEQSIKYGMSAEEREALEAAENAIQLEDLPLTFLFDITTAGSLGDMNQPAEVAVNSVGNIYVTEALGFRVNCYDGEGKYLFSFGEKAPAEDLSPSTFAYPMAIFIDKQDQVWVGDVKRGDIQVFTAEGKFVKSIAPTMDPGMEPFRPNGIHVLDDGRIVSTDTGNHRFVIMDADGKILLSVGTRGSEEGQLNFPDGLTITPDNTICVVDVINYRIQQFDLEGNFIRMFGQAGQSAGTFGRPKNVAYDSQKNRLWVSDAMGHIIQVFTLEGEVKSAFTGIEGQNVALSTPRGIFIKGDRVYIVNRLPHQVLVLKIG